MPTPLKDYYSPAYYKRLSAVLSQVIPEFDTSTFLQKIYSPAFEQMELKQRMRHTSRVMHEFLPGDFPADWKLLSQAIDLLSENGKGGGLADLVFPDYIEVFGLEDLKTALPAIEKTTQFISCEFAIRPFLIRYQAQVMKQMLKWSKHKSHHVRRFSSEGARPRLPWGLTVPALRKEPSPVLEILENLKKDPSEWVRKSVANNLNDIAKDHPAIVLEIARRWSGISKETDAIIKHGSRSLLKKGHAEILKHYGLDASQVGVHRFSLLTPRISTGDTLEFAFEVRNISAEPQLVRLEYAIYYFMKNGQLSKKVFKISERRLEGEAKLEVTKRHRFVKITTRTYYPGKHRLSVIVNGGEKAVKDFELV